MPLSVEDDPLVDADPVDVEAESEVEADALVAAVAVEPLPPLPPKGKLFKSVCSEIEL